MRLFRFGALLLSLLCSGLSFVLPAADQGPALQVNAVLARHPISPYVYGINYADESFAKEVGLPVRRWGGNATTRYNWKNNLANRAGDWYFENLYEVGGNPASLPDGSAANLFIDQDRRTGTRTVMTVPLIGWTPQTRNCGFSVAKYGPQQNTDPYWLDCGNGVKPDGKTNITGNDPHDTSAEIGPEFLQDWVLYLVAHYGPASQGGVLFYNFDNEPDWWFGTHRDVHPDPAGYDEIRDRTYLYGPAVKAADPTALTLGPVASGWWSALYSARDWVAGWKVPPYFWDSNPVDRRAHGDIPFVEWYLQQMAAYERQHGVRILDMLDVHGYIAPNSVTGDLAGNAATQALRLESTRALWDATYKVDDLKASPRLIPRMHEWVNRNYPGTKTGITEYNWGALKDPANINGALAQADILGIFGRERLDLAMLWGPGSGDWDKPWAFAFRIYLNYDGAGSSFGDIGIQSSSDDQGQLAIYAAQRSADAALTVLVINKSRTDLTSTLTLTGFAPAGAAKVYRYSSANAGSIMPQPDQALTGTGFSATFPASSITLLVAPATISPISLSFAHLAVGGGFMTAITITNTGGDAASGKLILTDQTGQALPVTFSAFPDGGSMSGSAYPISVPAGGVLVVTASRPDSTDIKGGWARIESAGGSLGGVATFQFTEGSTLKTIAGVLASPPVPSAVIPVNNDQLQQRTTGFAVANPGSTDVHVNITVRKEDGSLVGSPVRPAELSPLRPQNQAARFLSEYASGVDTFRGSMTLSGDPGEQFAVVALNMDHGLFTAVPVIPQQAAWKLVWSDEFDQADNTGPDSSRWVMETGNNNGWGNQELEYYTSRLDNAHMESGSLVIAAKQESYGGKNYTSARMKTQGKFSQKYGRIEARIRVPKGQGMWPAFWMLGDDISTVGWPTCGEIDIMEYIGREPSIVHATIHGPGYSGNYGIGGAYTLAGGGQFGDDYHVFAVEWDPNQLRWYIDGSLYETVSSTDIPATTKWVFDHPFFIILNLAVGGRWPGNPDATTVLPQQLLVDYVRVYDRTR